MPTRRLDPLSLSKDEDWEGNNAAFKCPLCGKVFLVSGAIHHGSRACPGCGKSTGHVSTEGGRKSDGVASIEWLDERSELPLKELYQTVLATRNLEIGLFWQRSNYFLVLNSALALGFFNLRDHRPFALVFAGLGFLTAVLWFRVCLGGKFWQARWEQRLRDFEIEHMPDLSFFSASPERIRQDVRESFAFQELPWVQRKLYGVALSSKPSVSYSMLLLSILFVVGWLGALIATVAIEWR